MHLFDSPDPAPRLQQSSGAIRAVRATGKLSVPCGVHHPAVYPEMRQLQDNGMRTTRWVLQPERLTGERHVGSELQAAGDARVRGLAEGKRRQELRPLVYVPVGITCV